MWKKPMVKEPEFNSSVLEELEKEETMNVSGGAIGSCYVAGYTCGWYKGSVKVGTCLVIGYACTFTKGGF